MIKVFKRFCLFSILLIVFTLFISNNVNALSSGYKNTNENILTLLDSGVVFYNVSFTDRSVNDYSSFGLSGSVYNSNSYDIAFVDIVNYYDINNNIIATGEGYQIVSAGSSNGYTQIVELKKIKFGYSVDDIAYYKLDVKVNKLDTISNGNEWLQYSNYDYVLNSYDVNMVVNENNTLEITEKIGAYFNVEKHGIFRKIPLKNRVTRLDGTTSKNRVKISDIKVSDKHLLYNENGYKIIKIGDTDYTLTGQKNYEISYLYNLGRDTGKEYDELYFNLVGDEWDTVIGNITFTITMPKEFDKSKVGFSSGIVGATDSSNVTFSVNGNTITGYLNGILNPNEALTVRLELPEGYFVGASNNLDLIMIISIILPIAFVLISVVLWLKYGKDDQVIKTVEFYPPKEFNSLEVGFLYNGVARNQDVTSLLVYLANKGYIKISETEEKSLFSKTKGFKITKLKEYDGNNINERTFLNGLFNKRPTNYSLFADNKEVNSGVNEVTLSELYNSFYLTMNVILSNINSKENNNKIFEKTSSGKKIFIILMIIATYCLITIPPILAYGETEALIVSLLFPSIGFSVLFGMLFGKNSISIKILGIIWGLSFGGIPWVVLVLPALLQDYIYLIIYLLGLLSVVVMILIFKYMPKRTPYGNEMLGKLEGFKSFLETVEKDRLESMVISNPSYFYDILPYTYVLGVSDKWIKKFEKISLQAPNWYDRPTGFDVISFGSFMNNTMKSAQSVMSSSPSSGSGGSGGGSSGGGSGGGGGGSW